VIFGLPLDLERPDVATMVAPTLAYEGSWRCVAYEHDMAIVALSDATDQQLCVAIRLHMALKRGLLVVL
jgi:hypothetical protein